ncbi:MAG TPA: MgtC/SapB family protein [Candidatus Micrarchaeia archaeon]|nr:MgtC/SapB family protein [Candidatus Micrarchaeia archaeon]
MGTPLTQFVPKEGAEIVLVLFLSFLIGLEREEQKVKSEQYRFGGVRTFPLLGLLGYALSLFPGGNLLLPAAGFAVVGAFLWLSYRHKLEGVAFAGMTTELSGLLTYVIGALVSHEEYWVATTLTVVGVALLELKSALESLARRLPGDEILTFAKFLLLTAVILPIVPNQSFGTFGFNPFKTWVVVAAVSAISYGSYLLQMRTQGRGGVLVAALLGGAYSSTLTTVVLAKRSSEESRPRLYSGSMLVASGVMYLRLLALLAIFNRELLHRLGFAFLLLAAAGLLGGWLWTRLKDDGGARAVQALQPQNPLELGAAFLFAALFVGMLFITHIAVLYLGRAGLYSLAGVMGVTDVDPFILSLAESAAALTPISLAGGAIVIAAASNNLIKGIYAYAFGDRQTGRQGLALLTALALLGLLPLFL